MAFSKKPKKESASWDCACRRNPAYLLFCPACGQSPKTRETK